MKKILIIEDERPLAEALKFTLEKEGYAVDTANDGAAGLERFRAGGIDLIVLDLMLPLMDGLEVCRRIRKESALPIIMLTAKDSDIDKVLGLELGADDYVTKPFNMREVLARIKAVLRRADAPEQPQPVQREWGDICMDADRHEVTFQGKALSLTPLEYSILELFMRHPRKALPREYLITQVWGGSFYGPTKTLDVHIRHLREKLEADPANPQYIKTVRGLGYKLEKPEDG
jgi:two-component system response regulator RegX3